MKPEFWTDEKVVELSPFARLLFIGLWNFCDDHGRMVYSPKRIKMQIFPADSMDISEPLNELRRSAMILIYTESRLFPPNPAEDSGQEGENQETLYLQVVNFDKHQKVDKRSQSKLPEPPYICENTAESPRVLGENSLGKGKGREKEKDNIVEPPGSPNPADLETSKYIFGLIRTLNQKHREPNFQSWANDIRLMRERDGRTDPEIRALFEWANRHHFWKTNILSPATLRKQWDKLVIQRDNGVRRHETDQRPDNSAIGRVRRANADALNRR